MSPTSPTPRTAVIDRRTKETHARVALALDGTGRIELFTGIGMLDHLLHALAFHAGFDLSLAIEGDLHVDDHHTAEDAGIALGMALDSALADRAGIERFGDAHAPLDEALARAVVDLSGRPSPHVHLGLTPGARMGTLSCENAAHTLESIALNARCALHVDVLRGSNDHHRAEAAYKAAALALRRAVAQRPGRGIPSTKGVLNTPAQPSPPKPAPPFSLGTGHA